MLCTQHNQLLPCAVGRNWDIPVRVLNVRLQAPCEEANVEGEGPASTCPSMQVLVKGRSSRAGPVQHCTGRLPVGISTDREEVPWTREAARQQLSRDVPTRERAEVEHAGRSDVRRGNKGGAWMPQMKGRIARTATDRADRLSCSSSRRRLDVCEHRLLDVRPCRRRAPMRCVPAPSLARTRSGSCIGTDGENMS